jgi:hypothetical protein
MELDGLERLVRQTGIVQKLDRPPRPRQGRRGEVEVDPPGPFFVILWRSGR